MGQSPVWIQAHPPLQIQGKCPRRAACCSVIPTAVAASGLLLINTQPQCQHQGGGSNADPRDGGVIILVGPVALTRLLSYSFLEAAKSWALEIAIPQKGRYICSTCGHIEHSAVITEPHTENKQGYLSKMVSNITNYCYYIHTILLSGPKTYNVKALVALFFNVAR